MNKIISRSPLVIGIIIFVFLLSSINLTEIWEIYTNINWTFFLLTLVTLSLTTATKALKWVQLIKPFGVSYPIKKAFSSWLMGFSISLVTPAKIGDFTRSYYLKKDAGISLGKSLSTVVIDRLFEVLIIFIFAILGVLFLIQTQGVLTNLLGLIILFLIAIIIGSVIFFNKRIMDKILRSVFMFFVPKKYKERISIAFDDFYHGVEIMKLHKAGLVKFTVLSVISWLVVCLQFWFLSIAFGLPFDYILIVIIISVVTLTELLPITISGIGTRDVAMILMFSFFGIAAATAIAYSIAMLVVIYIHGAFGTLLLMKYSPWKSSE